MTPWNVQSYVSSTKHISHTPKKKNPPLEQGINLLKYEEKSSKLDRLAEKENIQHALLLNSKEIHFIRKVIFFLHAF